ncbi:cytadherence high molecular weight protein 2-like isoform X1 [Punica granatum]|uniref:Cytadherence high molecular weight protein 2-like isoform X1 n=2 Tax=Punica granatum TaxID=22663 RepID=A0A6P8C3T9_PUNGR|nr:cytadherence high molecular weight protein 2-like isoform X1 [Punica granatum]XP_031406690.1 cytadherence high molecular weight protein 2-like isoform X1 [Punica granatum]PKI33648.1 hypothetical protein CRG98_045963 [Punica granatum]
MEKLSDDLGLALCKKDILRRTRDLVQSQANAVEEHFDSIVKAIGERLEQLRARERSVEERFAEVVSKESELEKKAKEFEREVLMREERLAQLERRLEDCSRECREEEDRLASATDYLAECLRETEFKKKELVSVRDSVEECRREFGMKKQDLDECARELNLKERELGSIKTLIDEYNEELTSKKKDLDAIRKSTIACSAEVDSKESELAVLGKSVKDLEVERPKEDKVESLQKCSRRDSEEIGLKKAELASLQKTIREVRGDLDLKERECRVLCTSIKNNNVELETKKKELESTMALLVAREGELKSREYQLEISQKELALARAERDGCRREIHLAKASFEERSRILEAKERKLQGQLMVLIIQHECLQSREKADVLVFQKELLDMMIQMSLDPAKLVLQAMQELDSSSSFDSGVTKRSCLLLLRCLGEASPVIKPQVKEAAMALAKQWKAQLAASSANYIFGVLALLRLIVVYELIPAFCPNELEDLVNSISDHVETNELRVLLGLSRPLPSPKVILLPQAEKKLKKLAQSSPKVDDGSRLQNIIKRMRMT